VRFTLTPPSRATAPPGGSRGATGGRALPVSASCGRSCVLSRDELGPELLHEHQPRNGDGVRYSCPAKVGKLACTACPLSQHLPPEVTRVTAPEVTRPDGTTGTPKVCNSSVTVPLAVLGKHHQKHRWGSTEWRRSYDPPQLADDRMAGLPVAPPRSPSAAATGANPGQASFPSWVHFWRGRTLGSATTTTRAPPTMSLPGSTRHWQ